MNAERFPMNWEQAVEWLRQQPDKAQLVADCYYDDPLPAAAARYRASEEWRAISEMLRGRSGEALDIGAGRGIASYALAKDGFAVTALEPDPSPLVGAAAIRALARDTGVAIDVCEEFSERLPFADARFDVVFARAVLHHTSDLGSACAEFYRVLKPGGVMLAIREHVISDKADLPAFFEIHPLHKQYGGENALLLGDYVTAIRNAGFADLCVLSPWASAVNYAPYTRASLQQAVADRFGPLRVFVRGLLKVPGVWPGVRSLMTATDRRPGRLYSFLAVRPLI